MGHVNPAFCQPKDSWRWQTSNSEYGKFYVRKLQREVNVEAQNEYLKRCEELTNELEEAKAQLEQLKITRDRHICAPIRLHDEACQTSPTSPKRDFALATRAGQPNRKMYKTQKSSDNGVEGHGSRMLLDHRKAEKHERLKLPLLAVRNARDNENDDGDELMNGDSKPIKTEVVPSGGGLRCMVSRSASRDSSQSSAGSAKDRDQEVSPRKRKIMHKLHKGAPKKQKASMIKAAAADLKRTVAAGGANLPPSQRYNFYRNYGYGGQGAKTSKGWHSSKNPWMPF